MAIAAACLTSLSQAQGSNPLVTPGFALPTLKGPGIEALSVDVRGFTFSGNTVYSTAQLQALLADAIGLRLDPSALDELRKRVTRLYVDAGFINSGAVIAEAPPGGYAQGVVPVQVIEGRVDSVRLRGLDGLSPSYARSRLLRDAEPLNIDRLQERFRLLLADPLFEKINSRIVPGDEAGAAVLDVDVQRARPYALEVFANNYRPPSVGSTAVGVHAVLRNLSGWGDVLEATLQHTQGGDPLHLGWSVAPLGGGTRVFASYDRSVAAVVEESLAAIDIKSHSSGGEIGLGQVLAETLNRRVEVGLAYARRKSATTLLGVPYSFTAGEVDGVSEIRTWRFSQDWTERWETHALAARSVFAWGTNNVDATTAQALAVGPALLPERRYLVWTGQVQHIGTAPGIPGELRMRGGAQYSAQHLLPLEQYAAGGVASVRGYRENAILRDRGFSASLEYRYPLRAGSEEGQRLSLLSFIDGGGGANTHAPWQSLSSAGVGLSWQHGGLAADLSWAKRISRLANPTSGNLQDRGIQFQLSYRAL